MENFESLRECLELLCSLPPDAGAESTEPSQQNTEYKSIIASAAWGEAIKALKSARKLCTEADGVIAICKTQAPAHVVESLSLVLKHQKVVTVDSQFVKFGFQFLANLSVSQEGAPVVWALAFPLHFQQWLSVESLSLIQFPSMMIYNCLRTNPTLATALTEPENIWLPSRLLDLCSHVAAATEQHAHVELDWVYLIFELFAQNCLEPLFHGFLRDLPSSDERKTALLHVLAGQCSAAGASFVLPPVSLRFLFERFHMLAFVAADAVWWPLHPGPGAVLTALTTLLGTLCLAGNQQAALFELGLLDLALELLQHVLVIHTPSRPTIKKLSDAAQPAPAKAPTGAGAGVGGVGGAGVGPGIGAVVGDGVGAASQSALSSSSSSPSQASALVAPDANGAGLTSASGAKFVPVRATATPAAATATAAAPSVDCGLIVRELVRLLAGLVHGCRAAQDRLAQGEGMLAFLNCCNLDDSNPFIREWAVFAIRCACEGHEANQAVLAALQRRPTQVSNPDAMASMGIELETDPATGATRVKSMKPPGPPPAP